jgi:hypothetical protein
MKITFGKYKNQELEDIIKNDPGYCKWLSNQPNVNDEIKEFINDNLDMKELMMRWGKYKNKTLNWIKNNDFVKDKCKDILEALN